jgi:hypothetical protein
MSPKRVSRLRFRHSVHLVDLLMGKFCKLLERPEISELFDDTVFGHKVRLFAGRGLSFLTPNTIGG